MRTEKRTGETWPTHRRKPRAVRRCAAPDCPHLSRGRYCPEHRTTDQGDDQ